MFLLCFYHFLSFILYFMLFLGTKKSPRSKIKLTSKALNCVIHKVRYYRVNSIYISNMERLAGDSYHTGTLSITIRVSYSQCNPQVCVY